MSRLLADLRYALRQLRRGPGFAATAILTLALGVAANVIVFGVIDALFLRPSSIPQASQLSFIQHREDNSVSMSFSVKRSLKIKITERARSLGISRTDYIKRLVLMDLERGPDAPLEFRPLERTRRKES